MDSKGIGWNEAKIQGNDRRQRSVLCGIYIQTDRKGFQKKVRKIKKRKTE
jgi:hypothetical protein